MLKKLFIAVLSQFFVTILFAQPVIKNDWKAAWIGEEITSLPNTFQRYRYHFDIDRTPMTAIANIATDSKYWLWINGTMVVFEGQLKRGPTPNDTYYDQVDIKQFLHKGSNTIAVLVWYWGKQGFSHNSSGKAGLLFESNIDGKLIMSDETWKVSQHLAYQNSLPPLPNFRLPEHNIHYDARLSKEAWTQAEFDDSLWKNAAKIGIAGQAPWNALWKRPVPLWFFSDLKRYENDFAVTPPGKVVMKLPKNLSVTPYFKIEAPAGLLIDIRTDNYFGGSSPTIRTEYMTTDGVQEFETPAYMNGHEVIYDFPQGVNILDLRYRESKYNTQFVGDFKSNDAFYNKLWQMSVTTLNVNLRDGIFDSPERERAQWWGDIVIVLEEMFYSCDERAVPAIQKAISNLLEWQKPDSVLFSPIPAGNWDKELPAQSLAAISKYGIWKYIEYSGDTAMIRYAYPFIKKYMGLWKLNDKGLVEHRNGGWDWHDWGDKIDVPLLDNAWYYMALESCYNMSMHLKLIDDALIYKKQMQSIKTNFQKKFWKGNRFASDDYQFFADDRGNGLAVCAGLVDTVQWKQLKPFLDTTFHAGPYLEKYILESYFIMNDATGGLKRMKERYDKMVNHPTITTLWEGWEIGSATFGGGTYNHGWSGGPLSLLSGYVAGIRPEAIGYNSYSIKPQLGQLDSISCRTLTAKGFLALTLKKSTHNIEMTVETIDAKGLIALPKLNKRFKNITVNGRKSHSHFRRINDDERYIYFECATKGAWKIIGEL